MRNQLKYYRERRNMSQAELADRSGVARSTISALENDRHEPSVTVAMKLAETLGLELNLLFPVADEHGGWAWQPPAMDKRYVSARVNDKFYRYPLADEATGLQLESGGIPAADPANTIVVAGCDPLVARLVGPLADRGVRLLAYTRPNETALELLEKGLVHVAGLHFGDAEGEANRRRARSKLDDHFGLLRLVNWKIGVVSSEAAAPAQLLRRDYRWINRNPGSGGRRRLKELLSREGVEPPEGYHGTAAPDHRAVAEAVTSRIAVAGISLKPCAGRHDLYFSGLAEEAYDLCFTESFEGDRRFRVLREVLESSSFRSTYDSVPGYTTADTGGIRRG